MNPEEVMKLICGANEDGSSKAMSGAYLYEGALDMDPADFKEKNTAMTDKAVLYLYPNGKFINIDMNFSSENDSDFFKMYQMLQKRLELGAENQDKIYSIVFNFIPAGFGSEESVCINANNPILHCITSLGPKKSFSTLRMAFLVDDVQFYELSDVNTTTVDMEVDYEERIRTDAENRAKANEDLKKQRIQEYDEIRKRRNL